MLFAFGMVFELPVFIFFLARIGVVNAPLLRRQRKYAILGIFVLSAVLTPPDVASQLMMAGPLMVLYEVSVVVAKLFGRKPAADDDSPAAD
jgi:sec-independent protein translocase protein TatC